MSADFRLVTLDCPQCGAPLAGEDEDLVFYCTACYSGFRVPESGDEPEGVEAATDDRLVPVEVSFLASPAEAPDLHLPFWLLPARVEILQRKGTGGSFRGLLNFFTGRDAAAVPGDGTFAIPAFRAPLARVMELALRYTFEMPDTGELPRERLTGGSQTVADARKLAEFVLISSEAAKPDTLTELEYRLQFGASRLLGVPFRRKDGRRWDVCFDLPA